MKTRVTQLDIARAAKVHNATVSLALRNSPLIPEATRQRIQALAVELGYRPDPALRALVAYRKGLVVNQRAEPIAYVTCGSTRWGWRENATEESYFAGAQKKGSEYGYQLEHFWLAEPGMSARRLSSVLFHRGIGGVLLAAQGQAAPEVFDFAWQNLCGVNLGHSPNAPALHRVANDPAGAVRLAVRKAQAAGYRRVGLILPEGWDDAADQGWSLGFAMERSRMLCSDGHGLVLRQAPTPAARESEAGAIGSSDYAALAEWFADFQPEVVLGSFSHTTEILSALGLRAPEDVAFVDLRHECENHGIAGVRQNCVHVGEVAVEMLVSQLQQNVRGLPAVATTTLVENVWCEGDSLPTAPLTIRASRRGTVEPRKLKLEQTAA